MEKLVFVNSNMILFNDNSVTSEGDGDSEDSSMNEDEDSVILLRQHPYLLDLRLCSIFSSEAYVRSPLVRTKSQGLLPAIGFH